MSQKPKRRRILRVKSKSLAYRIADKKRELAGIIANERNCSLTRAYRELNLKLELKAI